MDRLPLSACLLPLVLVGGWAVPAAAQETIAVNTASSIAESTDLKDYLAAGGISATAPALKDPIVAEPALPGSLSAVPGQDGDSAAAGPPPPRADPWPHKFVISVTAGTLGAGPEFGWRFAPRWGARANLTFIGFGLDAKIDGISYDGNLRLGSGGAAIDYYFSRNSGWHLSGGLRYDSNVYHITAGPKNDVRIGDKIFTPAQIGVLKADIAGDWTAAPTLTIGHTWRNSGHLQFGFEAGAMFHNKIEVQNLRSEGGTSSLLPDLIAELKKESGRIKNDLGVLNVFPILQIYIGYSF